MLREEVVDVGPMVAHSHGSIEAVIPSLVPQKPLVVSRGHCCLYRGKAFQAAQQEQQAANNNRSSSSSVSGVGDLNAFHSSSRDPRRRSSSRPPQATGPFAETKLWMRAEDTVWDIGDVDRLVCVEQLEMYFGFTHGSSELVLFDANFSIIDSATCSEPIFAAAVIPGKQDLYCVGSTQLIQVGFRRGKHIEERRFLDFGTIPVEASSCNSILVSTASPALQRVFVSVGRSLAVFTVDGTLTKQLPNCHTRPISAMFHQPSTNILATGASDGTISLWSAKMQRIIHFGGHSREVLSIIEHPIHAHILISVGADCTLRMWDLHAEDTIFTIDLEHPFSKLLPVPSTPATFAMVCARGMQVFGVRNLYNFYAPCGVPLTALDARQKDTMPIVAGFGPSKSLFIYSTYTSRLLRTIGPRAVYDASAAALFGDPQEQELQLLRHPNNDAHTSDKSSLELPTASSAFSSTTSYKQVEFVRALDVCMYLTTSNTVQLFDCIHPEAIIAQYDLTGIFNVARKYIGAFNPDDDNDEDYNEDDDSTSDDVGPVRSNPSTLTRDPHDVDGIDQDKQHESSSGTQEDLKKHKHQPHFNSIHSFCCAVLHGPAPPHIPKAPVPAWLQAKRKAKAASSSSSSFETSSSAAPTQLDYEVAQRCSTHDQECHAVAVLSLECGGLACLDLTTGRWNMLDSALHTRKIVHIQSMTTEASACVKIITIDEDDLVVLWDLESIRGEQPIIDSTDDADARCQEAEVPSRRNALQQQQQQQEDDIRRSPQGLAFARLTEVSKFFLPTSPQYPLVRAKGCGALLWAVFHDTRLQSYPLCCFDLTTHSQLMHDHDSDHVSPITDITCHEEHGLVATVCMAGEIRFWNRSNQPIIACALPSPISACCFTPTGAKLLVGIHNHIYELDIYAHLKPDAEMRFKIAGVTPDVLLESLDPYFASMRDEQYDCTQAAPFDATGNPHIALSATQRSATPPPRSLSSTMGRQEGGSFLLGSHTSSNQRTPPRSATLSPRAQAAWKTSERGSTARGLYHQGDALASADAAHLQQDATPRRGRTGGVYAHLTQKRISDPRVSQVSYDMQALALDNSREQLRSRLAEREYQLSSMFRRRDEARNNTSIKPPSSKRKKRLRRQALREFLQSIADEQPAVSGAKLTYMRQHPPVPLTPMQLQLLKDRHAAMPQMRGGPSPLSIQWMGPPPTDVKLPMCPDGAIPNSTIWQKMRSYGVEEEQVSSAKSWKPMSLSAEQLEAMKRQLEQEEEEESSGDEAQERENKMMGLLASHDEQATATRGLSIAIHDSDDDSDLGSHDDGENNGDDFAKRMLARAASSLVLKEGDGDGNSDDDAASVVSDGIGSPAAFSMRQRKRQSATPPPASPPESAHPPPPQQPPTPRQATPSPSPPPSPQPEQQAPSAQILPAPPLPRYLTQFRDAAWFKHHYPRAIPSLFNFIRPVPSEEDETAGKAPQLPLSSIIKLLASDEVIGPSPDPAMDLEPGKKRGLLFVTDDVSREKEVIDALATLAQHQHASEADVELIRRAVNHCLREWKAKYDDLLIPCINALAMTVLQRRVKDDVMIELLFLFAVGKVEVQSAVIKYLSFLGFMDVNDWFFTMLKEMIAASIPPEKFEGKGGSVDAETEAGIKSLLKAFLDEWHMRLAAYIEYTATSRQQTPSQDDTKKGSKKESSRADAKRHQEHQLDFLREQPKEHKPHSRRSEVPEDAGEADAVDVLNHWVNTEEKEHLAAEQASKQQSSSSAARRKRRLHLDRVAITPPSSAARLARIGYSSRLRSTTSSGSRLPPISRAPSRAATRTGHRTRQSSTLVKLRVRPTDVHSKELQSNPISNQRPFTSGHTSKLFFAQDTWVSHN